MGLSVHWVLPDLKGDTPGASERELCRRASDIAERVLKEHDMPYERHENYDPAPRLRRRGKDPIEWAGKRVVLAGQVPGFSRDEIGVMMEAIDGSLDHAVSTNTDLLVIGDQLGGVPAFDGWTLTAKEFVEQYPFGSIERHFGVFYNLRGPGNQCESLSYMWERYDRCPMSRMIPWAADFIGKWSGYNWSKTEWAEDFVRAHMAVAEVADAWLGAGLVTEVEDDARWVADGRNREQLEAHKATSAMFIETVSGAVGDALKEVVESQGGTVVDLGHGVGPEDIPGPDDKQEGPTETREEDDA